MKRSNLNFYDEAAFVGNEELFTTSEPFCTQNSKFVMSKELTDEELRALPTPFNNQLIYASSAGRTDQYFYKKYREASLHMDAGDARYFCADINSDMVVHATNHGIGLPAPLLTQETIDARMREDKESGLREYGNIFTSEGGDGQIIRRADIIRNSKTIIPLLECHEPGHLFGIAYDPARMHDNSVIGVAEYYQKNNEWHMDIVNVKSLADIMKKHKTPQNTPNQVKILKQTLLDYTPEVDPFYEGLCSVLVDAGSGGAGVPITDFLCEDWLDKHGNHHRGLIDPEFNEGDKKKFPNAVDNKLKLISPIKYKSELFEALIKMMDSNLIHFPQEYLMKGYLEILYEVDKKGNRKRRDNYPSEEEEKQLRKDGITIEIETYYLSKDEELALKQIDAMKTELVNIYRFKREGKDRFDLAPEKAKKMYDDRAYVAALLGWQLAQLNRSNITNRKKPKADYKSMIMVRPPKKVTMFS